MVIMEWLCKLLDTCGNNSWCENQNKKKSKLDTPCHYDMEGTSETAFIIKHYRLDSATSAIDRF